jgi:hypothetical protein
VRACVHGARAGSATACRSRLDVRCRVLCCAVLCCAVLCCAVLCCAVLCCAVLRCAVSRPCVLQCIKYCLQQRFGFTEPCCVVLTDDQTHPDYRPTRANILRGIQWLMQVCVCVCGWGWG